MAAERVTKNTQSLALAVVERTPGVGSGEPERRLRPNLRWLWLVYLVFFLMGPLLSRSPALIWTAVAGVVVFLPLYVIAGRLQGWPVLWPIGGMLGLGVGFAIQNPGASVFFVYAAAECGRLGSRRRAIIALCAVAVAVGSMGTWVQQHPFFWIPALTLVLVVGIVGIHEREMEVKNREVLRSREEVERLARVAERERIARDLHDLLGHTLSLVILKSELARRLAEREPERAAIEIGEVERIARQALGEVRAAVASYRSETLASEIDNARRALASAGISLELESEQPSLPALHEGVLALALREAVTNVIRHAGAKACRVTLRADNQSARLVIVDDGVGTSGCEGSGLLGMRERVTSLDGRVEVRRDHGTVVAIEVPLPGMRTSAV